MDPRLPVEGRAEIAEVLETEGQVGHQFFGNVLFKVQVCGQALSVYVGFVLRGKAGEDLRPRNSRGTDHRAVQYGHAAVLIGGLLAGDYFIALVSEFSAEPGFQRLAQADIHFIEQVEIDGVLTGFQCAAVEGGGAGCAHRGVQAVLYPEIEIAQPQGVA